MKKPIRKCCFQNLKEIKEWPFGKIKRYDIECNLTIRASSVIAIAFIHVEQTRREKCDIEKCPLYQTSINNKEVRSQ